VANEKLRKKKQYKTLLSVLASGSTPEARKLLKDYCGEDAFSENDLENKLASLYATSTTKLDLEKEFAQIHPHKEFILKYCQPMEVNPPINVNDLNTSNTRVVKQVDIITPPTKAEIENPTEGKACTCGCQKYLNADGNSSQPNGINNTVMALSIIGIVSIVALTTTIIMLKSNKI
jgi:hypothetical protein